MGGTKAIESRSKTMTVDNIKRHKKTYSSERLEDEIIELKKHRTG